MCAVQLDEADGVETIRSSVSLCKLTDVTDELVDVRFLQQTQLTHAGERVESFIDDELLGVAQALLEERLQDGGALPADVRRYAFNTTTGEWKHTAGEKIHTLHYQSIYFIICNESFCLSSEKLQHAASF